MSSCPHSLTNCLTYIIIWKYFRYLKEFRVEQCQQFLQHKCNQHKPYTCFHWHFNNQRRRRPVRRRDGTFNYSPEIYCAQYDESTGICPDGDELVSIFRPISIFNLRLDSWIRWKSICVVIRTVRIILYLSLSLIQLSVPTSSGWRCRKKVPSPLLQDLYVRSRHWRPRSVHEERCSLRLRSRSARFEVSSKVTVSC